MSINLDYIDQVSFLQGVHRSGWPFVLSNLYTLQKSTGIICDSYVDRTFHWLNPSGLLPYTKPWMGFIHHTFDTTYSDYNCQQLIQNQDFIDSLPQCKGLIVFSIELQEQWSQKLSVFPTVPIVVYIPHPAEDVIPSQQFTMEAFQNNPEPKIIQVGAWLRDTYAIFRLGNGNSVVGGCKKAALIGPRMENYYKPKGFFDTVLFEEPIKTILPPVLDLSKLVPQGPTDTPIVQSINVNGNPASETAMCRGSTADVNHYVVGAVNMLRDYERSVLKIPTLSDTDYDSLLTQNIVFLKLIDAAAVNTILECVMRNTPMLVNPLPAVVQVLGSDYPLYFTDLDQAASLITNDNILSATTYLSQMDKSPLSIVSFMNEFTQFEKEAQGIQFILSGMHL